jgi:hypothetical protein
MTGREALILIAGGVLGSLTGIGATWLAVAGRLVSPDNALAGFGMGAAGTVAGFVAAAVIILARPLS